MFLITYLCVLLQYLLVMMGAFAVLAWIGSLIDNLLLTYLLGTFKINIYLLQDFHEDGALYDDNRLKIDNSLGVSYPKGGSHRDWYLFVIGRWAECTESDYNRDRRRGGTIFGG